MKKIFVSCIAVFFIVVNPDPAGSRTFIWNWIRNFFCKENTVESSFNVIYWLFDS